MISDVQESETSKFKCRMESQKARRVTVKKIKIRRSSMVLGMDYALSDLWYLSRYVGDQHFIVLLTMAMAQV